MNKILLFVSILALGFTACTKDEDEKGIQGRWTFQEQGYVIDGQEDLDMHSHTPGCEKDYIEFGNNNTGRSVLYNLMDQECVEDINPLTYLKDGSTLVVTDEEDTSTTFEIVTLNSNTLKMKHTQGAEVYIYIFKRQ